MLTSLDKKDSLKADTFRSVGLTSKGGVTYGRYSIAIPKGTFVGRGGSLVESKPFDRRVVSSNPALALLGNS